MWGKSRRRWALWELFLFMIRMRYVRKNGAIKGLLETFGVAQEGTLTLELR